MAEPDPTLSPRYLGQPEPFVDDVAIERKRRVLNQWQEIADTFATRGWGFFMKTAADVEEAGIKSLLNTPASDIQAIARLQARVDFVRWLQDQADVAANEVRNAARELAELEGGTAE